MSEFRQDPVTGRWGIIAAGRLARPNEYRTEPERPSVDEDCPFCEGHEGRTPPEIAAIRPPGSAPDGPGWRVRAIPNRFPTVSGAPSVPSASTAPPFLRRSGDGVHEVIIESPRHAPGLPGLAPTHLRELFRFFRERVRAVSAPVATSAVVLFENWGPESGGTLWHPHAQIVATELAVPRLSEEAEAFARHARSEPNGCLLEALVAKEVAAAARVIASDASFDVVAPFASVHPYEMWLVPRQHVASFGDATDAEVDRLGELLPALLRALGRAQPGASYNWFVHGLRADRAAATGFHWHVEVAPRLLRPDGYELGAGLAVNPVAPETAAAGIRRELESEAPSGTRKR